MGFSVHGLMAWGIRVLVAFAAFLLPVTMLATQPPGQTGGKGPGKGGKGKGGPPGLIKPSMADTIKANIYADNWFVLYINGKLTAVDSIDFIPHNDQLLSAPLHR